MYRVISSTNIFAMSNIRGRNIKTPGALPFSFYFSPKDGVTHGPRVKPVFDPDKIRVDDIGTLKLCDDWEFIPRRADVNVGAKAIREMKDFFRAHLVLFCAVWDMQIQPDTLYEYFRGLISLQDLAQDFEFYEDRKDDMTRIHDVFQLEEYCRDNNLVNLYGN